MEGVELYADYTGHAPLVQRARLRPPRRRPGALLPRPPVRPAAHVDRGVPLQRLGRHAGGDVRLAAALATGGGQSLQSARGLLHDEGRLVGVGAAVDRLAPAVLAAPPRLRRRGHPPVRGALPGPSPLRRRGPVPHGHRPDGIRRQRAGRHRTGIRERQPGHRVAAGVRKRRAGHHRGQTEGPPPRRDPETVRGTPLRGRSASIGSSWATWRGPDRSRGARPALPGRRRDRRRVDPARGGHGRQA